MSEQGMVKRVLASLVYWAVALVIVTALFYGLDHGVMAMQGLPLNWDLTPSQ
jgi:hypothetical protein